MSYLERTNIPDDLLHLFPVCRGAKNYRNVAVVTLPALRHDTESAVEYEEKADEVEENDPTETDKLNDETILECF